MHKDTLLTDTYFSALGLAEPLQRALSARDHHTPTPIQAKAIPALLDGRDILGIAQTGTGKTAAFALPILDTLSRKRSSGRRRNPRALVLAPTRELAIQIGEEFRAYGQHLKLHHAVVFGGVSQKPQVTALKRGVDILVATPGRLLDLMGQGLVCLDQVDHFVLDEADRMLDMGFVRDVRRIVAVLPEARQSLLFSATMPHEISRLSGDLLNEPMRIEVAPQATPIERIAQRVYHVDAGAKKGLLIKILGDPTLTRVLVFARTKHRANRVTEQLTKSGITADAIHGNKSQGARQRALKRFRDGEVRVLVATDIAARGIDVDEVSHVINYELPNEPESYVHRIGRTARAGADGIALSLCDRGERAYLKDIERLINCRLAVVGDSPVEKVAEDRTKARSARQNRRHGPASARHRRRSGSRRRAPAAA